MPKRTCALEPDCEVCLTPSGNGLYNPKSKRFVCQSCLDDMAGSDGAQIYLVEELKKHCIAIKGGYTIEEVGMEANLIVYEFNSLSATVEADEWDNDFAFPNMETVSQEQIRLEWKQHTGIELGWQVQHKYLDIFDAKEELKKLQKKFVPEQTSNVRRKDEPVKGTSTTGSGEVVSE